MIVGQWNDAQIEFSIEPLEGSKNINHLRIKFMQNTDTAIRTEIVINNIEEKDFDNLIRVLGDLKHDLRNAQKQLNKSEDE